MADREEIPSFGIEETMQGVGDKELLEGLYEPETSTEDPKNLTPIIKEAKPTELPKKPEVAAGKEIIQKEEGEENTNQDVLKNFLSDGQTDEDDNTDDITPPPEEKIEEQIDDTPSTFTSLAKDLFKLGVFTTPEGETEEVPITTPQEFLERFNQEKEKGAIDKVNNFLGQFGEDYQDAFTAIFVKGVSPKEYFGIYNNIVDFTNLDLTQEDNQIAVIRQALTDQGFEPEDVNTEVDRLKNYGDLESVATKHHKVLVKKEAQKLQQVEVKAERELQQKTAIRNQYISNVQGILQDKLKTKEFDGIPLNPKLANELQDFLLVDKYKLPSGETLSDFDRVILELKNPENHAMKVKVALLLKILEKDPTLSTIQKTGITKKAEELFESTIKNKPKSTGSKTNEPTSWFLK